ncbi:MAG: penicillin-binding protein 1A [Hellea sp.]|nr:penicillin-binding protein 1A [Hellea sp.]
MSAIRNIFSWRTFKWLFITGLFVFVCVAIFVTIFLVRALDNLPSYEFLTEHRPPVASRVHAGDGKLIKEYSEEHRIFVPIEAIPKKVQHAFVAAEDQRFYTHDGFDKRGFTRAMVSNVGNKLRGHRLEGGSTITQQVAKNILVGNERTVTRKVREIVTARRIEKVMDKDRVLELYLNEIYLGERSFGVAAAALNYFDKSLDELTLSEVAYLAALPKAPNNYDLGDNMDRAISRRNYVIERMVEDGYATRDEAEEAREQDLINIDRLTGEKFQAAGYFVEEARKEIAQMYGEDDLYKGGLSIRTTLDTNLQLLGSRALRNGLEAYDKRYGYRGPLNHFDGFDDWKTRLDDYEGPADVKGWRVALVMEASEKEAKLAFAQTDTEEERLENGKLTLEGMKWAAPVNEDRKKGEAPKSVNAVINTGDLILVSLKGESGNEYILQQVPEVNGGLIAMDPHTGRILALVGGYSFRQNQFNRATQAQRQPGSAFKPFVYAAALDNGYTPASLVLDAPFVIPRSDVDCVENEDGFLELRETGEDGQVTVEPVGGDAATEDECERFYKPGNYAEGRFYGESTLRLGLEKSRNLMTVRLANDISMADIMAYGRRFNIYDDPRPELGWVLGAGETTMLRLATAYSMLVNGGKNIDPFILDRVQDGKGKTIFIKGDTLCDVCLMDEWDGGPPPELPDIREDVIDPVTAYQVTFMLQGVVENGTGVIIKSLGRPLGGKTGTTNDYKDAWFMGFSPDLVVGVYVGYDTPRSLNNEAGSTAAAPIFKEFMQHALKDEPIVPFRIPEGVTFSPINRNTGEPSYIGAPDYILEAFRPGTEPKIGETNSTIRVGSGTDSFVYGISNPQNDNNDIAQTGPPGDVSVDTTQEAAIKTSENPIEGLPKLPVETQEPEDDVDLDDGLY